MSSKSLFYLVGIQHRPHGKEVVPLLSDGTSVVLLREPDNPHDPNAIQVLLPIGYVKATQAKTLALQMDAKGATAALLNGEISRNEGHYAEIEVEDFADDV